MKPKTTKERLNLARRLKTDFFITDHITFLVDDIDNEIELKYEARPERLFGL